MAIKFHNYISVLFGLCLILPALTSCKPTRVAQDNIDIVDTEPLKAQFEAYKIIKLSPLNTRHSYTNNYTVEYGPDCKIFLIVNEYKQDRIGLTLSFTLENTHPIHRKNYLEDTNCQNLTYIPDAKILKMIDATMSHVSKHYDDRLYQIRLPLHLLDSPKHDVLAVIKQRTIEQPELAITHKETDEIPRQDMTSKLLNNSLVENIYRLMKDYDVIPEEKFATAYFQFTALDINRYGDLSKTLSETTTFEDILRISGYTRLVIEFHSLPFQPK